MRQMLEAFINTLLSAQADSVCGADYGTPRSGPTGVTGTGTATWTPGSAGRFSVASFRTRPSAIESTS